MVLQVIILARESGLKLELSDVPVENLVPEQLVRTNFFDYAVLINNMYSFNQHGYPFCRLVHQFKIFCRIYQNLIRRYQRDKKRLTLQGK